MGWVKDSISWAHFVTVLRESIDEIKKSLSKHSDELLKLHHQNGMLLQQLVQQANEMQRMEKKLESIEAHLRTPIAHPLTIDALTHQPKIQTVEANQDEP